jgi:16S rRNA pseudouridine516 synthase
LRLDKAVSDALAVSRAVSRDHIKAGRITVDGRICKQPDAHIGDGASVEFDGRALRIGTVYIMMNKPLGVLSATEDKRDTTAMDLLPQSYARLKLGIAGRLDKDSEGLLLITNDGELNHRLTSPLSECEKVYIAVTDLPCGKEQTEAFKNGIKLKDHDCRPAVLTPCGQDATVCRIRITEGKYRQIRRMLEHVGRKTLSLKRVAIGPLKLDEALGPGEYRALSREEADALKKYVENGKTDK